MRKLMYCAIAMALVMFSKEPAAARERTVWRHSEGFFENNKGNDWFEKSPNGKFQFKEVRRTETFIELENIKSNHRVRLLDRRCISVDNQGREIKEFYRGGWEE